jgi:hypothetical protein
MTGEQMPDIDLHKAYDSIGESVHDLFDRTEEGFFVPLYQREYTWEEENINQLFEDLVSGIRELAEPDGDNATTFLGTAILTTAKDKKQTVKKGEDKAQPTAVQLVIDGQQRISTIALIAIQLTAKVRSLITGLPHKAPYKPLHDHCDGLIETLEKLYTTKLGRGAKPPNKPKIIRAKEDLWTYDGDDDTYSSPIAQYIASFIRTGDTAKAHEAIGQVEGTRVRRNVELIVQWLEAICDAHVPAERLYGQFPVGAKIVTDRVQEYVLGFKDASIRKAVTKSEVDKAKNDYFAAAIFQIFLLCYYLLRRCGVNRLQPTREDWGFDMFQALNATGTPLTVMETFLPQVMQAEDAAGHAWEKTLSSQHIDEIDELFSNTSSNEQKNLRTNELFGTFALCYDGEKLGNKFSAQRRWISKIYDKQLSTIDQKRRFLGRLARIANFYRAAWYMEEVTTPNVIKGLDGRPDGEFASLLVQYLKEANSKLSAPILARFYSQALDGIASYDEFVEAAKACAAFFTLWRSARSTSGLDEIYRKFFRGSTSQVKVPPRNWKAHPKPISAVDLKNYFSSVLLREGIRNEAEWISESSRFLLYTELKSICRFVLFVAAHDRVEDKKCPGLTSVGTKGACPTLTLTRWMAKDHKSLEHVAPQNPPTGNKWDAKIYSEGKVQEIGNLILLPLDVNKHADNKEWVVKYLHYCHLGLKDKAELDALSARAKAKGINLSKKAIDILSQSTYNCVVEPILKIGEDGVWDATLIDNRTQQMKAITWSTLNSWLKP